MPELPEVETVRRVLGPLCAGRRIERVSVRRPEVIAHPGAEEFCARLAGREIAGLGRRGKFLSILLADGGRVTLHLRMTGCLLLAPADHPEERHTHVVFALDGGEELRFSDMRRFGRFWLLEAGEEDERSGAGKLGPEPFDPALTAGYLQSRFGARKKAVKECLMEQEAVAGIGNIYSDEILFAARIHPARAANTLSAEEWGRLAAAIPERLAYFIEKNAITAEDYLATKGKDYRNTPYLQVYGHEGDPCPACGAPLRRMVIGGRSSVFCPRCQGDEPC